MTNTMRVSLPGYNALTDTDLDHFALHADEDNVLIKEFERGSYTSTANETKTIPHNLGYIPFYLVFFEISGKWYSVGWGFISSPYVGSYVDTTNLTIYTQNSTNVKYYIFYDDIDTP